MAGVVPARGSGPARSSAGNAIDLARFASGLSAGNTSPFGVVDPFEDVDDELLGDLFDDDDDDFFPPSLSAGGMGLAYMAPMVDNLEAKAIELAGGPEAYATIDVAPLDDAEFDWSIVPPEIRDDTAQSLVHLDRWAVEMFDAEVRTIARTVLAHINEADPRVYKRSPRPDALAAAVRWFIFKRLTGRMSAKEIRSLGRKVSTQKDLSLATGVSSTTIGTRQKTVASVVERSAINWPSILHSSQRRELVHMRGLVAQFRLEHS